MFKKFFIGVSQNLTCAESLVCGFVLVEDSHDDF